MRKVITIAVITVVVGLGIASCLGSSQPTTSLACSTSIAAVEHNSPNLQSILQAAFNQSTDNQGVQLALNNMMTDETAYTNGLLTTNDLQLAFETLQEVCR